MNKYVIRKGKHFSGFRFHPILFPESISFEFMFTNKSKYYSEPHSQLREQWNKLAGMSLNLSGSESIRLAWRYNCDTNLFEVSEYAHIKGEIKSFPFFTVKAHERHFVSLSKLNEQPFGNIGYKQFPYFGGKDSAPHDISIYLKFL